MNILFYYYQGGGGGLANILELLRVYSESFSDYLTVLTNNKTAFKCLEGLKNINFVTHKLPYKGEVRRHVLNKSLLSGIAKDINANLVWSINLGSYKRLEIPHVLHLNNAFQVYPFFQINKYAEHGLIRLFLLRMFFKQSLRVSRAVIVQTDYMASLVKKLVKEEVRVRVVSKPVLNMCRANDRETLQDGPEGLLNYSKKPFIFVYAANYIKHKNHKVIIKAAKTLFLKNENFRLILTVSEHEFNDLTKNVKNLVENGVIQNVGWLTPDRLSSLYRTADACLMPSKLESLSSCHLEAMAFGLPQISSKLDFSYGVCGESSAYADPNCSEDWATQMKRLIHDEEYRRTLVKAGTSKRSKFPVSWLDVSNQIRTVFKELV